MSVTKIDDTELFNQNRFHVNQPDVPGKTAQEMKEFMDYVPRQVLIPKINELTDAVNASAPSESVYKKEETYNKSEADGTFAKTSDVYSKTETDSKLTQKADALDVYTKEQTYSKDEADAIKSGLLESSSDRVIADVAAQPTSDSTLICRENGVLKILQNVEIEPIYDGAALEDYGTPAPCVYDTEEELIAAIEEHGLTDTSGSGTKCIYLFKLYNAESVLLGQMEIRYTIRSGYYMYFIWSDSGPIMQWYDTDWAAGSADMYEKFAYYGYTNLTVDEVSDFAKQVFCGTRAQYSEIATKAYVDKLIQNLQS